MTTAPPKPQKFSVRIDAKTSVRLGHLARKDGRSRSDYLRALIDREWERVGGKG